jgi:hypothetical protein
MNTEAFYRELNTPDKATEVLFLDDNALNISMPRGILACAPPGHGAAEARRAFAQRRDHP